MFRRSSSILKFIWSCSKSEIRLKVMESERSGSSLERCATVEPEGNPSSKSNAVTIMSEGGSLRSFTVRTTVWSTNNPERSVALTRSSYCSWASKSGTVLMINWFSTIENRELSLERERKNGRLRWTSSSTSGSVDVSWATTVPGSIPSSIDRTEETMAPGFSLTSSTATSKYCSRTTPSEKVDWIRTL